MGPLAAWARSAAAARTFARARAGDRIQRATMRGRASAASTLSLVVRIHPTMRMADEKVVSRP
jgi:hypothetical protein